MRTKTEAVLGKDKEGPHKVVLSRVAHRREDRAVDPEVALEGKKMKCARKKVQKI